MPQSIEIGLTKCNNKKCVNGRVLEKVDCDYCKGKGVVGGGDYCPRCLGTCKVNDWVICPTCGGSEYI